MQQTVRSLGRIRKERYGYYGIDHREIRIRYGILGFITPLCSESGWGQPQLYWSMLML